VALDAAGEVVWYYKPEAAITDMHRLANGNLVYLYGNFDASEIDMFGNVAARWHAGTLSPNGPSGAVSVATDTFHHELYEMPSGNFLTLSSEVRDYAAYPSSETNANALPASAHVVGDIVVEFQRDGTIVGKWPLLDLLDPYRIGYGSLTPFWNTTYSAVVGGTKDWSHSNAVIYDDKDDAIIVSVRHQDALVKISRQSGKIVWILGTHDGWGGPWQEALLTPDASVQWQYHEHAPMLTAARTLLMYDNGDYRARPFATQVPATQNASRAVEFAVDDALKTVKQVWSYGGVGSSDVFYSPFICDADEMPATKNVLITDGGRTADPVTGLPSDDAAGARKFVRILEVTREMPGQKVFEATISDPTVSFTAYRGEKLSSLYPPAAP
jgi:hypothetical protein